VGYAALTHTSFQNHTFGTRAPMIWHDRVGWGEDGRLAAETREYRTFDIWEDWPKADGPVWRKLRQLADIHPRDLLQGGFD